MVGQQRTPNRSRLRIPALLVVGALAVGACGGSGSDSASSGSGDPTTTAATKKSATTSDNDSKNASKKLVSGKPVIMVPIDGTAPDGYKMVTAQCEVTEEQAAEEEASDGFDTYHSDITFAMPADWKTAGRGSGGSGGTTGTDVTMTLMLPSNKKVKVDYSWDNRGSKGEILRQQRRHVEELRLRLQDR